MALRVKCKCGGALKVSSKLADKRVACPRCKRAFRIPAERFKRAAKSRTKKPPVKSASPAVPPPPEDLQPANLDDELLGSIPEPFSYSESDILSGLESDDAAAGSPQVAVVESPQSVTLGYAPEPRARAAAEARLADPVQGPRRGFWADAFGSFVYPARGSGNAVTLLIILVIAMLQNVLAFGGIFGVLGFVIAALGSIIIYGWLASLYFSVIRETATGSDDLPTIRMEEGFMEDIIRPGVKFIGAIAVVLAPGLILSMAVGLGALPQGWSAVLPLWFGAGIFLLPVSLLLFALDSVGTLLRLDLVFTTIFRTILPYLAIWLMLLLIAAGHAIASAGDEILDSLIPGLLDHLPTFNFIGLDFLITAVNTYLTIVAMRIIGLYYLHFKRRFTIVME